VDLVVLSEVRWGYFRTRKQFLLSRFPEDWRIFFAQPPAKGTDDPWTPRREGRVTAFTVPFLKPATTSGAYNALATLAGGRAAIEWGAERWLSGKLRELGVEPEPAVLVSNIYCPGALRATPQAGSVLRLQRSAVPVRGRPGPGARVPATHRAPGRSLFVVSSTTAARSSVRPTDPSP
jgi:hypothetical protein